MDLGGQEVTTAILLLALAVMWVGFSITDAIRELAKAINPRNTKETK